MTVGDLYYEYDRKTGRMIQFPKEHAEELKKRSDDDFLGALNKTMGLS